MNNIQRLQMETKGIELDQQELIFYLQENGLKPHDEYNATSQDNIKAIYQTALSILESVANNPSIMKTIRLDDMTVSDFHDNFQSRFDRLYKTIRQMKTDQSSNSDIFMLYL
ncbi:hypothetical protein AM499_06865 [Bacillus sp. FJAT-22090]|uniref:hypothetical protein n=1 Tax=Bacillus sp. FJAT-22090 TaxID=1581038 RepID=UPI0006AE1853|nr:hypothetical protein [Bacillus sp. FJAT-22090]ALC85573.1 hypothetical protein AM499_06865 [Bacillus sp. FJAT-22090]